jgi:hypothetical protein
LGSASIHRGLSLTTCPMRMASVKQSPHQSPSCQP